MRKLSAGFILLVLAGILSSWGGTGHRTIGSYTSLFLNEEMEQFSHWPALLSAHGSDADYRKGSDPSEGPKHYLDVDNYPEFKSSGRIPSTLDSIYMSHHPNFVDDQGYLPWATEAAYDSLVARFRRRDWDNAVLVAADLGHYVGDGHMPLHLTRNYNGQFTGNDGIHSRYESTMINKYVNEIKFTEDSIHLIQDVNKYIFDYIYRNYVYIDSLIAADDYASNLAGSTSSSAYTYNLWEKTRSFTIPLFNSAAKSLSELIFTAWTEAGKPLMDGTSIENFSFDADHGSASRKGILLEQNYPNPFNYTTTIQFSLAEKTDVNLSVYDANGRLVARLMDRRCPAGSTKLEWNSEDLPPGNYYLVLKSGNGTLSRKMIKVQL